MGEFLQVLWESIAPHIQELLNAALVAIFSYIGYQAKKAFERFKQSSELKDIKERLKVNEELALLSVQYVEQIAKHVAIASEEKLQIAKDKFIEYANKEGISVTEGELDLLIESALIAFEEGVRKANSEKANVEISYSGIHEKGALDVDGDIYTEETKEGEDI